MSSSSLPPKSVLLRRLHRGITLEGDDDGSTKQQRDSCGSGVVTTTASTSTRGLHLDPSLIDEFFILHHTLSPVITHHQKHTTSLPPSNSLSSPIESALATLRAAVTNLPISEDAVTVGRNKLASTLREQSVSQTTSTTPSPQTLPLMSVMTTFIINNTPTTDQSNEVVGGVHQKDYIVETFLLAVRRVSSSSKSSSSHAPPPHSSSTRKSKSSSSSSSSYLNKSCYTQTRMDQIVPQLYCGSYHPAADRSILLAAGITHIVCCINVTPRFPDDFTYLVLGADDTANYDISQHFKSTNIFIHNALTTGVVVNGEDELNGSVVGGSSSIGGGAVLVHCGAGISRAPSVVAAYLISTLGMSSVAAIQHIRSIRNCASPNPGFRKQLLDYSRGLRSDSASVVDSSTGALPSPPPANNNMIAMLKQAMTKLK